MITGLTRRALLIGLGVLVTAACADRFQPLPPAAAPDLTGTWVGTWGGLPTTLVIEGRSSQPPSEGLIVGSVSVDALLGAGPEVTVHGTITHRGPDGSRSSTFTGQVGRVGGRLTLLVSLPTFNEFQEVALAVEGDERLVGTASTTTPEGPRGAIQLVRQAPKK